VAQVIGAWVAAAMACLAARSRLRRRCGSTRSGRTSSSAGKGNGN